MQREREDGPQYNRFGSPGSRFEKYKSTPRKRDEEVSEELSEDSGGRKPKKIIAWDVAPGKEYFEELFRVSKHQIIWGGNYFELPPTRCFLIWKKLTITDKFSMAMCEYAWTSFNSNAKLFEFAPQGKASDQRFHPCLPEGTKVRFNGKWKNIEDVQVGDSNMFGVVSERTVHEACRLVDISANGETVTATWNHPFLVKRGDELAWIEADRIREGDELCCPLNENTASQRKDICGTERMAKDYGWNIASFGKSIMARFLKGCKYIIKILTRPTTIFRIYNLSRHLNTNGYTKVADLRTVFGISLAQNAVNTNRSMRIIGTSTRKRVGLRHRIANNATSKRYAKIAVCELRTVGSVIKREKPTLVYNLTISGIPAFETRIGITHNTQKPVELYKWVYGLYAKPGMKILDTHLGSGSSRIAAWDMGIDFVGTEIDPEYFRLEEERFKKHIQQPRLDTMIIQQAEQESLF